MKVLILGCGYTGSRLAKLLLERHIAVSLTTRSGEPPAGLAAPCYPFDSAAGVTLPDIALQGITHVLHSIPPDAAGKDPVATWLLPRLSTMGLAWFGYLSITGVYGDSQGAWVDEDTPINPQNPRSQNRAAAELAFLSAPVSAHIFRLPGIYGPGRSNLDRVRQGNAQRIDRPGHVFSRVHVDDIVQTLWHSMQQPTPGEIYNVCDDLPCAAHLLTSEACQLLGVEPPPLVPFDQVELSPMAASFWSESRRASNAKIKTKLGVKLLYPTYKEGLRGILATEKAGQSQKN